MHRKSLLLLSLLGALSANAASGAGAYQYRAYVPGLSAPAPAPLTFPPAPKNYATWSSTDKGPLMALSNGDLTVSTTGSGTWNSVRASIGVSSGAWYWEVTVPAGWGGWYHAEGISNEVTLMNNGITQSGTGVASFGLVLSGSPSWFRRGYTAVTPAPTGTSMASGDVYSYALDMATGTLKMARNCTWLNANNPVVSGVTGVAYPAVSLVFNTHAPLIANFGQNAFACAVPAGYNPGVYN